MRSIRLWLVVYLLALLGVVMGTAAFYVYRETEKTVVAKQESTEKLLRANHEKSAREAHDRLDQDLLKRAQSLAGVAVAHWKSPRGVNYFSLGLLGNILTPNAHLSVPMWIGQETNTHLAFQVYRPVMHIDLPETVVEEVDNDEERYYQFSSELGRPLRKSPSVGTQDFRIGEHVRKTLPFYEPVFDDVSVHGGAPARRVTLKTPAFKEQFMYGPPLGLPGKPPPSFFGNRKPQPRDMWRAARVIFIQFAGATEERDTQIAALKKMHDADLRAVGAQSEETLASMRTRMLILIGIVLVVTAVGGIFLVRLALRPVKRIAQAVSEVSERDFQLHVQQNDVPVEMAPIVEKLKEALASLRDAFAREKQAVADISHDLRTPIAALLTTAQVCLRKQRPPEEYRKALETCSDIGEQLRTLVERLLLLARLDAGVDQLRPQEVNVPDLAAQCVAVVRPLAEARNLELKFERNGPVLLKTDPDKLREVLTNLLDNAVQYNRPGGSIELSLARDNGHVRMEVKDTGVGIPLEARDHLFERFYRVDPSRQSETTHCGLGLAIVKGYVDLMGGTIEVDSAPNEGSTFRILLPAQERAVAAVA